MNLREFVAPGRRYAFTKRALDLSVAVIGLLLGAPLLVGIALLVRLSLGSPILFWQLRPGLHGRPFRLVKFRSMRIAYGPDAELLPDSVRLGRTGRLLRASSMDELPELWNVLRGEMSLVGPRPLLMEYLDLYTPQQARRHEVKPGITGWAQVNGRNALTWEEKFALDLWYVENRSMMLDLQILGRTVSSVFAAKGIAQAGRASADRFRGSIL